MTTAKADEIADLLDWDRIASNLEKDLIEYALKDLGLIGMNDVLDRIKKTDGKVDLFIRKYNPADYIDVTFTIANDFGAYKELLNE